MRRLNTASFIEEAIKTHHDKYDYSKAVFTKMDNKILIICPIHGEFMQTGTRHLLGHGCAKCGKIKAAKILKKSTEDFLREAGAVHGDKYNYALADYINNKIKVKIICSIHGVFLQGPKQHIYLKHGCPSCSGIKKKTTEEFVVDAIKIHGDKYDYSKVHYVNNRTKIVIICPVHGEYKQRPHDHLHDSNGCPKCNESKGEKIIANFLDQHNILYTRQKRFKDCRTCRPLPFDFYLPNYNICIEFDGRQHFEPVRDFGGEKAYETTIKNDQIKNKYCEDNGIRLLRISYQQFNQIEEILDGTLMKEKLIKEDVIIANTQQYKNTWDRREFDQIYLEWRKKNKPTKEDIEEMIKEKSLQYCNEIRKSLNENAKNGIKSGDIEISINEFITWCIDICKIEIENKELEEKPEDYFKRIKVIFEEKMLPHIEDYFIGNVVKMEILSFGSFFNKKTSAVIPKPYRFKITVKIEE